MRITREVYDINTHQLHRYHVEDVESLLDEMHNERSAGHNGFSESKNFRKIASIPMIVVEAVYREYGINLMKQNPETKKHLRRFLQTNYKFRAVDKL